MLIYTDLLQNGLAQIDASPDSLYVESDTLKPDTVRTSINGESDPASFLDEPVDYEAKDSLIFDVDNQMVYLYGTAKVVYKDIHLEADYIEMDMDKNEVFAKGLPDSTGKVAGKPVFTEGSETFESTTITYNFHTRRGMITGIISEAEGGYLHSTKTKKLEDGSINISKGKYTTCDAENPHFYLALTKAKVIPDDKIVFGPAYMVIEDIPLPLILPFGFFPNQKTQASGILIPEYGEEKNRGFFLRNGGYYFALSDYFDLAVTGDVYSNGTWGFGIRSNYRVRYRFGGNLNLRYFNNVSGDLDIGNYVRKSDYSIVWSHQQDSKSNPTSSFSARVNISSSSYDKNHSYDTERFLTNTKQSSISYSKRWEGSPFNFSGSLSHSQNSQNKTMNLNLPKLAFNMNRIYPFRGLSKSKGSSKWYQNIELSYSANFENRINTFDSLLFTPEVFDDMNMGFKHQIPLSANFKPFRSFNISPRIQYQGVLYTRSIRKEWDPDYIDPGTGEVKPQVVVDTIQGLQYAHSYLPSISMSLNPKIYGMYQFTKPESKVVAIRHVITPTVGFSFVPDMRNLAPNYYDTVQVDTTGRTQVYSYFQNGIYGTPSINGKAGMVNFSLKNNIEMKLRSSSDTLEDMKKVKILDNLQFSSSYNIFADSLMFAPLNFSGYTTIFDRKFRLNFSGQFDPYALDANGRKINKSELSQTGKLFRFTRFNIGVDFRLSSKQKSSTTDRGQESFSDRSGEFETSLPGEPEEQTETLREQTNQYPGYVDFSIPWNMTIRYNFNYSKPGFTSKVTQTLNFTGDIRLTEKWRIGISSGWDFEKNSLSYTSVNIFRDLHCWEMRLSWIPIGHRQSYSFSINAKASILKDLKYEKRKDWRDY